MSASSAKQINRLFNLLPEDYYGQPQFMPSKLPKSGGLADDIKVLSFNYPAADRRVHRFDKELKIYGITKAQREEMDYFWSTLLPWQLNRAHYRKIAFFVREPEKFRKIHEITCTKNGANGSIIFTAPYGSNYDSRFDDGIETGGSGGGGDLSPSQIYIGIPKFTASNATLTANAGFNTWPWDPRTKAHDTPANWPSAESVGNYFVDNSHVSATDTGNTYGYPDRPRLTRPTTTSLPAGTLIEFGGGTIDNSSYGFDFFGSTGTAENPIFIRGSDGLAEVDMPTISGQMVRAENVSYLIFENFRWNGSNTQNNCFSTQYNGQGDTDHIVFRNNIFRNIAYVAGGSPIVSVSADDRNGGCTTTDIVIYNNILQGEGETAAWYASDQDHHAVGLSTRTNEGEGVSGRTEVSRVWILDNTLTLVSGNGVQVISVGNPTKDHRDRVKYVWVGGNTTGASRQAGLWAKRSSHIIFSQNTIDDCKAEYVANNGQACGCQYGPADVWYIANRISNMHYGIQQTDTATETVDGTLYMVGNILTDLRISLDQIDTWRDGTAFSFTSHGDMERYAVLNTVYGAVNGMAGSNSAGTMQSAGNIYALQDGDLVSPATAANAGNFYQTGTGNSNLQADSDILYRIDGSFAAYDGGTSYSDVATLEGNADYSNLSVSNPTLANPVSGGSEDFTPSHADTLDGGTWATPDGTNVRSVFLTNYGLDIAYDINGNNRSTTTPDIGAVEVA